MTTLVSTINAVKDKFGSQFKRVIQPPTRGSFFTAKLKSGILIRVIDFDGHLLIEAYEEEFGEDIWSSGVYLEQLEEFDPEVEKQLLDRF